MPYKDKAKQKEFLKLYMKALGILKKKHEKEFKIILNDIKTQNHGQARCVK